MKTIIKKTVLVGLLVLIVRIGNSQGFVNFDFESANLTGYSPGNIVPASNAFPGWTVNAAYIPYDDISLSGESISIIDTNSPNFTTSIQGKYYALFEAGNSPSSSETISLGQSGTIPDGTESMTFWGNIGGLQITFAGQSVAFSEIGSTANYNIYGANISQFAGDSGQLLFSLPAYDGSAALDNIQFSTSPIPEPSTLALFALGGVFLVWRNRRIFSKA
jgi:hypothetical protein